MSVVRPTVRRRAEGGAFTLIEVMVAVAIFMMAIFAVISLVTQNVRAARSLKIQTPHAGMLASLLSLTNSLEEGVESGDFSIFGDGAEAMFSRPDQEREINWEWEREAIWIGSNGFFQVHYRIFRDGEIDSELEVWVYKPQSPAPSLGLR